MPRRSVLYAITVALFGALVGSAHADILWMNSAGADMGGFDPVTGAQVSTLTQNKGNGRGIVTVGSVVYYTVANSGNVFTRTTGNVDTGIAFTIAGASGLQAISFDGTNFWVGDYSGTNRAYYVSPTGTLLNTITLANAQGFYDGLEFFNGKLIANRFDGGFGGTQHYDIYALDGTLLTADFISTAGHGNGTGIAFDGTNFYVSNIFDTNNEITVWSGVNGSFIRSINLAGSHGGIEDLSFDFAARVDTCGGPNQPPCSNGGTLPEPGMLSLASLILAGFLVTARRRSAR